MIFLKKAFPSKKMFSLCEEKVVALLGDKQGDNYFVTDYFMLENKSKDKENHYYVGRDQYIKAQNECKKKGKKFLGVVHSHTPIHTGNPSAKDIETARFGMINGVLHNKRLTFYNKQGIICRRKIRTNFIDSFLFSVFHILGI